MLQDLYKIHFKLTQELAEVSDLADPEYKENFIINISRCKHMIDTLNTIPNFINTHT